MALASYGSFSTVQDFGSKHQLLCLASIHPSQTVGKLMEWNIRPSIVKIAEQVASNFMHLRLINTVDGLRQKLGYIGTMSG